MRRRGKRALESRQKVLDAAATLYRQHGFSGVGVITIARAAGMTHGGFYTQFPQGKEELVTAAIAQAFREAQQDWDEWIATLPKGRALVTIIDDYLSNQHCANLEVGCPLAALAADVSRQGPSAKSAFTQGVKTQLQALAGLCPADAAPQRRVDAMQLLTRLAGTILIARAVDDPALADELLSAAHLADSM